MKQVVIALLTTTINRYSEVGGSIVSQKCVINDLTSILDYIQDIPEENKPNEVLNIFNEIVMENKNLNKTVKDLEESCQYMCDVEKNQLEKMELLKAENEDLKAKLLKKGEI
ncbi:hypothetical protein FDF50_16590 [Clostridium botulinum]|uniref:Uncharacterized protein n=1 Tax=Clostridium botulinum TaxID=1491 RepID=A0A6G4HQT9_CLOBO|nr:hypothetical protein [Clostridium botulinum]MBO0572781.1 hypothetical protein [Clostridium botulinum]NFJ61696.1 hypothetical protein [Clostridium botulinum]NFQ62445.1 hypothetical protein [Clostridium botulinum]NFR19259.1 hypothetical protein [Clostridium botulinum]NFU18271.1 hypothetical protein [Clostridium botulinum]